MSHGSETAETLPTAADAITAWTAARPGKDANVALSILDKYMRKGERKGREEGRRDQAQAMLSKALEHRFGRLPAAIRKRIATAEDAELQRWFERALDTETLDEVFAAGGGVSRARAR